MFEILGDIHGSDVRTGKVIEVQDASLSKLTDALAVQMAANLPVIIRNGISSLDGLNEGQRRAARKDNKRAHHRRVVALTNALWQLHPEKNWKHVLENGDIIFGYHSAEHVDGLNKEYTQAHTTKETKYTQATSRAVFRAYPANTGRHEELIHIRQAVMEARVMPNSEAVISVMPDFDMPERFLLPALDTDFGDPEVYEVFAGAYDTLVFPNGYNATEFAEPTILWTHEFSSVLPPGCTNGRREIAISRVESL